MKAALIYVIVCIVFVCVVVVQHCTLLLFYVLYFFTYVPLEAIT